MTDVEQRGLGAVGGRLVTGVTCAFIACERLESLFFFRFLIFPPILLPPPSSSRLSRVVHTGVPFMMAGAAD